MKYSSNSGSCPLFSSLVAPLGLVAVAGVLLAIDLREPKPVLATNSFDQDTDGDGLVDRQERVLGTLFSAVDSDQDGFSDVEELARGSSPVYPQFVPEIEAVSTGITAHGERDGLHAVIGVYLPRGDYLNYDLRIGILIGRRIVMLPQSLLEARSTVQFLPANNPNAIIALVDFRFDRSLVDATGHLTMFSTVGRTGSGALSAAAAMDLFDISGVIALAMPDPYYLPTYIGGGRGNIGNGPGTIYKPLTGGTNGEDVPTGWSSGEVCFQTSQPVGVSGPLITHEVVSAECSGGWDGSCPPNCSSSTGSTYTSVDPAILVGG